MHKFPDFSPHNYQVIEELGRNREGGRISYLAQHSLTSQSVVIKQFRFLQTDATWESFKVYEREITLLQELNHPRIPRYLNSFETPDGFCLVQEYKNAPSLSTKRYSNLEDIKPLIVSILEILIDLQTHYPPIIHRDIKPENILVDTHNNAYLIDFGLARKRDTQIAFSSVVAGTPGFMPPETLLNRPLSEASDLYSLGVTMISLLTQTPSVEISHLMDHQFRFNLSSLLKNINPRFRQWLQTMVDPNPDYRFANAKDALFALEPIDIMAIPSESMRLVPMLGAKPLVLLGVGLTFLGFAVDSGWLNLRPNLNSSRRNYAQTMAVTSSLPSQWYQEIKPHCNALEVATKLNSNPPPKTSEGIGYGAACYALAGKIEQADRLIEQLPIQDQADAAGIVFKIGHPIADQGDDASAGPIMELVVKYQPDNYMALYHAGMSAYILQDFEQSQQHLEQFLEIYHHNDGWRKNALIIWERLENK